MTGKEALERLEIINRRQNNGNGDIFLEMMIQAFEKDLEVLEIIRTHKLLNYVIKNKKCANMYHLSSEKLELLKDWLKQWQR